MVVAIAGLGVTQMSGGDSAGSGSSASGDGVQIRGTFVLLSSDLDGGIENCSGDGGYSDFGAGMNVTVRNDAGEIIGSSQTRNAPVDEQVEYLIATGVFEESDANDLTDSLNGMRDYTYSSCTVLFDVETETSDFYEISIANRGEISMSAAELAAADFGATFTLGT